MSNVDFAPSPPILKSSAPARGWLTGFALRMVHRASTAQQHSDWIRLHNMGDYLLKDVGLPRDHIGEALRSSAGQPWNPIQSAGY